jgi:serine/threonine protein kinase
VTVGLLLPLLLSLAAFAAPPEMYWAPLRPLSSRVYRTAVSGDHLVAVVEDGSLMRLEDGVWSILAGPPPGAAGGFFGLVVSPEGRVLLATNQYVWTWQQELGWSEPVAFPPGNVYSLALAPTGRPWAVGIHGYVASLQDGVWVRHRDLPLDSSVESNLHGLCFDRDGVGWASNGTGLVLRIEDGQGTRLHFHGEAPIRVDLDRDGRAVLFGDTVRYLDDPGAPPIYQGRAERGSQHEDGWWLVIDGRLHWLEDGLVEAVLTTTTGHNIGLALLGSGRLVLWEESGRFHEQRPGRAPILRDVADDWGLGSIADHEGAWSADLDGDGLDDLLLPTAEGSLRLLLQQLEGFHDATEGWGLELVLDNELTLCDLDGNGRVDLLARERVRGAGPDDAAVRLRYLRTMNGWFDDVTDSIQGEVPAATSVGDGLFTCADVDQDGDLDVLVSGGWRTLPAGPKVALYENIGEGRLRVEPLPERGLGLTWGGWVQQVLPGDLDNDGLLDFVGLVWWNQGHVLLQGAPGGGLRDRTRGSGLDSVYTWTERGWLAHLDDDPFLDLLTLDRKQFLWAWRGGSDFAFAQVSASWGLDRYHTLADQDVADAELVDLDRDGWLDIVAAARHGGLMLALGSASGAFLDRSDALPSSERAVLDLVSLDLGGDGDQDLLVLREGAELLLENLAGPASPGPARVEGPGALHELRRRLVWLRPWADGLPLGLWMLCALAATLSCRRFGSRVLLGRAPSVVLLPVGVLAVYLLLADRPLLQRWVASTLGLLIVAGGTWAELVYHRFEEARRVGVYRLLRCLGEGGMGSVWEAWDSDQRRRVALKLVKPHLLRSEDDRKLFEREGRLCSRIHDQRVVTIYKVGFERVFERGSAVLVAYLAMELLQGVTLRGYLSRRGRLPSGEAAAVALEICRALEVIHEHEVVHRDIKPDNVMLVGHGRIKVMDFGAARKAGHKTRTVRQVLGTLAYLAPEQMRGFEPDPRSDLWSVGVTLYELLCGVRPFAADDVVELQAAILMLDPSPPCERIPGLDPALSELVMCCLVKDPAQRVQLASELTAALEPFAIDTPTPTSEEQQEARRASHGPGAGLLPVAQAESQLAVLRRLLVEWWAWRAGSEQPELETYVASLVRWTVQRRGSADLLAERLGACGVDLSTSLVPVAPRDPERVVFGRARRAAAVPEPCDEEPTPLDTIVEGES